MAIAYFLYVRGIPKSACAQHAFDWNRPGALGREGVAAVSCNPSDKLWPGNAPDHSIKSITKFNPKVVILDPVNAFVSGQNQTEVKAMLLRLVDS